MPSNVSRIHIDNFNGMDAHRDFDAGEDYATGQSCLNIGRRTRMPLQARMGLRPVTSSNGNTTLGGSVFAMGALVQGGRLSLVFRVSGGYLAAARDVGLL